VTLLALPILVPLLTGVAALLLRHHRVSQRIVTVVGTAMLLACGIALFRATLESGVIAVQMGAWPAPAGITLVADIFSATMILMTGVMGLGVAIYGLGDIKPDAERSGYHPLVQILLMGVCGSFLTGDLFNLYVWYEVMLLASFVLLTIGGGRPAIEGAIKYVTLNLIASALLLAGAGLLYGTAGTLNMADLAAMGDTLGEASTLTAISMLFLVSFAIKAGSFPLFFWLPASYHTPPVAVTAIFSALLTKVGVYSLVRTFTLVFVHDAGLTHTIILVAGALTMITGVLGAAAQWDFRRILSFHIISQIGYLLVGLGLAGPAIAMLHQGETVSDEARSAALLGLGGVLFFTVHVMLAKTALFLVCGIAEHRRGSASLSALGGLVSRPVLAITFLIAALSLAGIPPLSGFWAKLIIVRAGLEGREWMAVAAALGVGLLTLFSMVKIWAEAFWRPAAEGVVDRPIPIFQSALLHAPPIALGVLIVLLGLAPAPLVAVAERAAAQLIDPREYIDAVAGAALFDAPAPIRRLDPELLPLQSTHDGEDAR